MNKARITKKNGIMCFKSLIEQLPYNSFEAKELELTTRIIQPLLQPLFEDRAEKLYLRWTNTQTEEFNQLLKQTT
jgi:hypothetical protein